MYASSLAKRIFHNTHFHSFFNTTLSCNELHRPFEIPSTQIPSFLAQLCTIFLPLLKHYFNLLISLIIRRGTLHNFSSVNQNQPREENIVPTKDKGKQIRSDFDDDDDDDDELGCVLWTITIFGFSLDSNF
jgi:hypothetical protein